ncbi:MAG: hypothetical protein U0234_19905 [Sandaracinus sp.]
MHFRPYALTALLLPGLAGCSSPAPGGGLTGAWRAMQSDTAVLIVTFDGPSSGSQTWELTDPNAASACVTHVMSAGTFSRSGTDAGNIEITQTSGDYWVDGCTDPTSDVARRALTAAELGTGHIVGTYVLAGDALDVTFPLGGSLGDATLAFHRL